MLWREIIEKWLYMEDKMKWCGTQIIIYFWKDHNLGGDEIGTVFSLICCIYSGSKWHVENTVYQRYQNTVYQMPICHWWSSFASTSQREH